MEWAVWKTISWKVLSWKVRHEIGKMNLVWCWNVWAGDGKIGLKLESSERSWKGQLKFETFQSKVPDEVKRFWLNLERINEVGKLNWYKTWAVQKDTTGHYQRVKVGDPKLLGQKTESKRYKNSLWFKSLKVDGSEIKNKRPKESK